ncbi:MAG: ferritin-like domain-containing protein [Usitatibacteraceae bacterium]
MNDLAALLRAMQLYAHAAHNLAKGKTFFEDHEAFAAFYGAYAAEYDDVIERIIGIEGDADIAAITKAACDVINENPESSEKAYSVLLASEKRLCKLVDQHNKSASLGTQNLLQGIADKSEMRQYKIKRRLA